jgi:hypothetical protein
MAPKYESARLRARRSPKTSHKVSLFFEKEGLISHSGQNRNQCEESLLLHRA